MATLIAINLLFDNGTSQTIQVGPQQTTIKTPFGVVNLTESQPLAPTGVDIADNPGKYDGTSFDPTIYALPRMWNGNVVNQNIWAEWYKADPVQAMDYLANKGILGKPMNLSRLSDSQKKRMGIS